VTGRTIEKARKALRNAKLVPGDPTFAFSETVAEGSVISQTPADGQAPQGSTVELVVSEGPPPRPVPNVVGRTQADADRILSDAGFVVIVGDEKFSNDAPRGEVLRQSPAPPEKLQPGATISLVVSLGPKTFPCPGFNGLSRAAAQALADEYGLQATFVDVTPTPGSIVLNQSVAAGASIGYGDPITLYLV
jgi:serine/threonine-protein kinase